MLRDTKVPIASVDIPSGWDVEKGFHQPPPPSLLACLLACLCIINTIS